MDFLKQKHAHPRDDDIVFIEESHEYIVRGVRHKYTSVTTWNHSLFSHFDADACALKITKSAKWRRDPTYKYYQLSIEQIKALWEENRDQAANAGTQMHLNIEQYYNQVPVQNDSKEYQFFLEFARDFAHLEPYRTEWCVYYEEPLYLAGSIDMVFRDRNTGEFLIYDWKRSKEIEYECAFEKKTGKIDCLKTMPDTNFWHYSLQLNTYRYILESKYDITIAGMFLVVLHPDNFPQTYDRVQVHDLRHLMPDIFLHRQAVVAAAAAAADAEKTVCGDDNHGGGGGVVS